MPNEKPPPSLEAALFEKARRLSLKDFVRRAWPIVEPSTDLIWNWHLDVICDHLEAVTQGEIRRLLINIPPGTMKSLLVSVFWPAWEWLRYPEKRILYGSYERDLSVRDRVRARQIIEANWYQETFDPPWQLSTDQNVKSHYENTRRGFHLAISRGGKGTGWRGDRVVVDDPISVQESVSEAKRKEAARWIDKVLPSRLNDPRKGAIVIVMQRVHESDPSGIVLDRGGWGHLCLPMEYEPDRPCETSLGNVDPRTEPGELLFDELYPVEVIADLKRTLGTAEYAGQYQQRPAPAEGNIIQIKWVTDNYYMAAPKLSHLDEIIQSWDMRFIDSKERGSFVVGQVWGRLGYDFYLLDQVRERLSYTETKTAVRELSEAWPQAYTKLIEAKANGSAIIDELNGEIGGMIGIDVKIGKFGRYVNVSPMWESGNVHVPHPDLLPWVDKFRHEITTVPEAANDDQADAAAQALGWFKDLWIARGAQGPSGQVHTRIRSQGGYMRGN